MKRTEKVCESVHVAPEFVNNKNRITEWKG